MKELDCLRDSLPYVGGGLFLEPAVPNSFISSLSVSNPSASAPFPKLSCVYRRSAIPRGGRFLSVSLSVKESEGFFEKGGEAKEEEEVAVEEETRRRKKKKKREVVRVRGAGAGAMNTTKHLWAGAVAAMVSRSCPLLQSVTLCSSA